MKKAAGKPWPERKKAYDEHLTDLFRGTLTEADESDLTGLVEAIPDADLEERSPSSNASG